MLQACDQRTGQLFPSPHHLKSKRTEVPCTFVAGCRLRIPRCHHSSWGRCCDAGSIPGPRTSTCHGHDPQKTKTKTHNEKHKSTDIYTYIPVFLLRLRSSTRTSFSILCGYITALLERCILVFKDMLNAKLLPLQTRLRAWAMSKRTRQGLLRSGHWGDPSPIGRQDVDPNPVHTKTCRVTQKIKKPFPKIPAPQ